MVLPLKPTLSLLVFPQFSSYSLAFASFPLLILRNPFHHLVLAMKHETKHIFIAHTPVQLLAIRV